MIRPDEFHGHRVEPTGVEYFHRHELAADRLVHWHHWLEPMEKVLMAVFEKAKREGKPL